jgi:Ion channel
MQMKQLTPKWSLPKKFTAGASLAIALFYLSWLLPKVARYPYEAGALGNLFAALIYIQLWLATGVYAMRAAAAFYGLTPPRIFFNFDFNRNAPRGWIVVVLMFLSYALTVYGFGIAYIYLSSFDPSAFNKQVGITDGMYFSVVTAATVGYGDIFPISHAAKVLTILEIAVSLLYVVLLFSVASSYSRDLRDNRRENADRDVMKAP